MPSGYVPPVNLHSPGPIGDVTPSTLAGTTLTLTGTAQQLFINYDGSHRNKIYTNSAGYLVFDNTDSANFKFVYQGSTVLLEYNANVLQLATEFGCYAAGNNTPHANRAAFSVYSIPGLSGTGIGCPAAQQVSIVTNDLDRVICNNTTLTLVSGINLQLGNAAATGLVAGALAALTTASIVIYDSTGTAYRVPCVTP
jgi:hypothetical protein